MNAVVELEDLRKSFTLLTGRGLRRHKREVLAVAGIDLRVLEGESVAFIGPNGAGKSTTIKMLTGILHPSGGRAKVLGLTPWLERGTLAYKIGAVFGQRSQLWYHLPRDTFELLARVYNIPKLEFTKRRDELIERFRLAEFLETPVRKLALTQRLRAEVAAKYILVLDVHPKILNHKNTVLNNFKFLEQSIDNLSFNLEILSILTGSLAFFLGNAAQLCEQWRFALITFSTYPMVLFDGPVKFVLFTLIPAGFISGLPVQALRTMNLEFAALTVLGSLAVLAAGVLVFYLGLRRYEGGNLLEMRG